MKVKRAESTNIVVKHFALEVKAPAEGATVAAGRYVDVVASTETEDGDGEVLVQDWDLSAYEKNPVVLYGHNRPAGYFSDVDAKDTLPIGFATGVKIDGSKLTARLNFVDSNASELAEFVYQGMKQGSLRAVSVGFIPTAKTNARQETHDGHDVFVLSGLQLREISVVPIGCNPDAVALDRAKSLDAAKALISPADQATQQKDRAMAAALPLLIATLLGLQADASEADAVKALQAKDAAENELKAITGQKNVSAALGVIAGWKATAEEGAKALAKLAELEAKSITEEAKRILDEGAKAGKVTPALRASLEKRPVKSADDVEYLKGLVGSLPVVAKTDGHDRHEEPKDTASTDVLSEDDHEVRKALGLTVEQFVKTRSERKKLRTTTARGEA